MQMTLGGTPLRPRKRIDVVALRAATTKLNENKLSPVKILETSRTFKVFLDAGYIMRV
jgi:hypothetical protein